MREDNRYGYKRYILTKQEVIESFNNPYKVVWQASGYGEDAIWTYENLMYYLEYHQHYSWGIWDIRRYESAEEFIEDGKRYNYALKSLKKGYNLYKFPVEVYDGGIYIKGIDGFEFVSFDNLLRDYRWEDGRKCGIINYATPSISIE